MVTVPLPASVSSSPIKGGFHINFDDEMNRVAITRASQEPLASQEGGESIVDIIVTKNRRTER